MEERDLNNRTVIGGLAMMLKIPRSGQEAHTAQ